MLKKSILMAAINIKCYYSYILHARFTLVDSPIHKCIERRLPYYQVAALLKSTEICNEKNTLHHQHYLQTISNTVPNLTHTEN